MSTLGIVVVNYGSAALVEANLAAVEEELRGAADPALREARLVVVDNHAGAEARAAMTAVADRHGWILVAPDDNLGFGGGVDAGVAAAREAGADTYLLLNPDARISADDLARLLAAVRTDPLALAAPVVLRPDGSVWSRTYALDLRSGVSRRLAAGDALRAGEVPWLSGAVLLLTDELYRAVGGLGSEYFLYWEDVDLSYRVGRVGGRVLLVEDATAVHDEGGTHREEGAGHSPVFTYYNVRNRMMFAGLRLTRAERLRWLAGTPRWAWRVLMWSGKRATLARPALATAALRGLRDGLALGVRSLPRPVAPVGAHAAPRRLRVLTSFPEPRPTTNPYIVMLKEGLQARDDLVVDTFSWRRALTGTYDVFHVHWPEILVGGHSPLKKLVRQGLFVLFVGHLWGRGTAVVRTMHNLELPQGISRRERALLRWFDRRVDLRVRINDSTELDGPVATIPHGHYVDWFAARGDASIAPEPGRAAYVGLIRRYKAVDTLVGAWARLPQDAPVSSLVVAGAASSDELLAALDEAAAGDPRIEIRPGFLTEEALADTVRSATLVVQPAPAMHNSGTVLAALSLGRPVLVPDNEVNRRLAAEVGDGWIVTFTGELTPEDLLRGLEVATATLARGGRPDLGARDWTTGAALHARAYRRAADLHAGAALGARS